MSALKTWPFHTILLVCGGWITISLAILAPPLVRAFRWAGTAVDQAGVAAISFSLLSLLVQMALVLVPPVALVIVWLKSQSPS